MSLPDHYYFLDQAGHPSLEELSQFRAIRALFQIDNEEYLGWASSVLKKAAHNGQVSTAKSGSIMAFEERVMTKTMTTTEAATLFSILDPYITYLRQPRNLPDHGARIGSLLPQFLGAYVYKESRGLSTVTRLFVIMTNVFCSVPPEELRVMERFDLKGSSEQRAQRQAGHECMDFDLLKMDRKLVPADRAEGERFLAQLERDVKFLASQQSGLMDYSLIVGLVSHDVAGGMARLSVRDESIESLNTSSETEEWQVTSIQRVAIVGIVDVLQFWTLSKRIAHRLKRTVGMERDACRDCQGEIIDTVPPANYAKRFLNFLRELLTEGSWVESLKRLAGGNWLSVLAVQIDQLPEAQKRHVYQLRLRAEQKLASRWQGARGKAKSPTRTKSPTRSTKYIRQESGLSNPSKGSIRTLTSFIDDSGSDRGFLSLDGSFNSSNAAQLLTHGGALDSSGGMNSTRSQEDRAPQLCSVYDFLEIPEPSTDVIVWADVSEQSRVPSQSERKSTDVQTFESCASLPYFET